MWDLEDDQDSLHHSSQIKCDRHWAQRGCCLPPPPALPADELSPGVCSILPDKPLDGSGSRSDWMGSAGDLSREAAPACSHAQLNTHSVARSARRSSIPHLVLVSAPDGFRKTQPKLAATLNRVYPQLLSPVRGRLRPNSAQWSARFLSTNNPLGASFPFCFIAHFPDILKQPPAGRRGEMMGWGGWWVWVDADGGNRRPYQITKA